MGKTKEYPTLGSCVTQARHKVSPYADVAVQDEVIAIVRMAYYAGRRAHDRFDKDGDVEAVAQAVETSKAVEVQPTDEEEFSAFMEWKQKQKSAQVQE